MVFLSALSEYCLQREKQHRLCIPAPHRQSAAPSRGTSSRSLVLIQMHQKPPFLQFLFCKVFDLEGTWVCSVPESPSLLSPTQGWGLKCVRDPLGSPSDRNTCLLSI